MSAKQVFNRKSKADKARARQEAINKNNRHGTNMFFEAVESNRLTDVEKLFAEGADVNARTTSRGLISNMMVNVPYGVDATPLHAACLLGSPHIVDFLIDAGADVKAKDATGHTPLDYAILSYNYFRDELERKEQSRFTMQRSVEKSSGRLREFESLIGNVIAHGGKTGMFQLPERFRVGGKDGYLPPPHLP
ncbi:MAG: ankyrin repeat domain-containing protein [Micavibrio sp.]|nr:ankyrin repeat domain-containing protein [Micavibrio sp.]